MKTTQEIFIRVVRAMARQGWRKSHKMKGPGWLDSFCLYQGPRGRRCPVGHLIPKLKDRKALDKLNVGVDDRRVRACLPTRFARHGDFLYRLQNIHDGANDPNEMQRGFKSFADLQDLPWPLND